MFQMFLSPRFGSALIHSHYYKSLEVKDVSSLAVILKNTQSSVICQSSPPKQQPLNAKQADAPPKELHIRDDKQEAPVHMNRGTPHMSTQDVLETYQLYKERSRHARRQAQVAQNGNRSPRRRRTLPNGENENTFTVAEDQEDLYRKSNESHNNFIRSDLSLLQSHRDSLERPSPTPLAHVRQPFLEAGNNLLQQTPLPTPTTQIPTLASNRRSIAQRARRQREAQERQHRVQQTPTTAPNARSLAQRARRQREREQREQSYEHRPPARRPTNDQLPTPAATAQQAPFCFKLFRSATMDSCPQMPQNDVYPNLPQVNEKTIAVPLANPEAGFHPDYTPFTGTSGLLCATRRPYVEPVQRHDLVRMEHTCRYCGALQLPHSPAPYTCIARVAPSS
ncbi:hypothetical protein K435DRAFT_808500 [Dendrothele bispora CBS 962.96]|uniref:Uncharacterized protein n=1 Tax=Dendrothele bispora (strain CBS 962.96) TaxID=1314807 RepID=A0A4S8L1N6_DENBC|nr:hypothetical protein K435DRAFT_808500 [Dendrothele bispora CBS 962.96]